MEVVMSRSEAVWIEVEAAQALAQWKAMFAEEASMHAKRLAAGSDRPQFVTVAHYRQAAQLALKSLSAVIADGVDGDANRRAA